MKNKSTATFSIIVNAKATDVWEALTDPTIIKQYFFGTEAVSSWKKGSPLIFKGVWDGKPYEDKGTILEIDPPKRMKYSYWSSFSGTEDKPENYANITYELKESGGTTNLKVLQDGLASEEAAKHSEQNWETVFGGLKKLVESRK